jgi:hypothetical protein
MSGLPFRLAPKIFGVAAAVGGAAALSAQPPAASAAPQRECFNANAVSGFSAGDEHAIYVRVGAHKVFELETLGACPNLDWTQRIGLKSRGSSFVCTGMDVDLIVPQDGMGHPLRCAVRAMRRLSDAEVDALPRGRRP